MSSWKPESNGTVELLRKDFQSKLVIPFVGSGASYSSNLPSWSALIRQIAAKAGFDADVFASQGTFPQLFDYYFSVSPDKTFQKYVAKLSTEFTRASVAFAPSPMHEELTRLPVDTIYTTNYDDLIERAYEMMGRSAAAIITYSDLASRPPDGTVQVVKYHGDFSIPESLVLTERQYFERMSLDTAMDVRLRADALGRSLLFIGYSLTDVNVRYLLYRLNKERLSNSDGAYARADGRRSYIVSSSIGEVQKAVLQSRYNVEAIELLPGHTQQDVYLAELLKYCRT